MVASTRSTSLLLTILLGAAAVTAPPVVSPAYAQKGDKSDKEKKKLAKQYVDAGLAAQNAGDYDQAVALYEKAYEQVPHPLMFFNIGQAQRLAGRDEEALAAYQRYLDEDPSGAKAKEVKGFVAEIQPRVEKARAAAAEADRKATDAEAKRLEAEANAASAEQKRLDAEAARQKAEADAAAKRQEPEPVAGPDGRGRRKLGLIVGAGGVVVAAVGGVFGVLAIGAWGDAEDLCGADLTCDSDADTAAANTLADDARLRGNLSTVIIGVGAAAAITGVVLYLTAPSGSGEPAESAWNLAPTAGGAVVTFGGSL